MLAFELAAAELPTKITVEYVRRNGEADVTWSATTSPSYNPGRNGLYRFTGTLSGLEDGVVNWAVVEAVAEVNYSDAVKPGVYLKYCHPGRVSNSVTLKAVAESYDGANCHINGTKPTRSVLCGELIEGATDSEYTFTLPTPGTAYYYCVVTNTNEAAAGEKWQAEPAKCITVIAKRAPRDSARSDTGATPAAPESPATPPVLSFSDVSEGDWFYGAVQFAHENGLMMGTGDGKFSLMQPQPGAWL